MRRRILSCVTPLPTSLPKGTQSTRGYSEKSTGNILESARIVALAVLFVIGAMVSFAYSQSDTATVVGNVTDATGGVVPGANVVVTHLGTNLARNVTTDETGSYRVTALVPGDYSIVVEKAGFKKFIQGRMVLRAFQTLRLDASLALGEVTDTISVTGQAPVVNTEVATHAESLPEEKLKNYVIPLPMVQSLAYWLTTYGVDGIQYGNDMVVAGGRQDGLRTTVDGATVDHFRMSPPALSIQEVRLVSSNANAEFPTMGTAAAVTKSGTNTFHGAVEYVLQNAALNSLGPFGGSRPVGRPNYQISFSGGGPVAIPRVYDGRNRTFLFGVYDRAKSTFSPTPLAINVPTALMRQGNFSQYRNSAGDLIPIVDPRTGSPFAGNIIPADRLSSVSRNIVDRFYPLPNSGSADNTLRNYTTITDSTGSQDQAFFRVDQKISDHDHLSVTFMRLAQRSQFDVANSGAAKVPGLFEAFTTPRSYASSVAETHIFSPNIVNEFRFSFNRHHQPQGSDVNGQDVLRDFGIQGIDPGLNFKGVPAINISTFAGFGQVYSDSRFTENRFNFIDNLSIQRGRHAIKIGTEFIKFQTNRVDSGQAFGTYNFTGQFTRGTLSVAGHPFADFLLGFPTNTQRFVPRAAIAYRNYSWGMYVQDDFKVTPRLTLNLGLRYDLEGVPIDQNGLYFSFNPRNGAIVLPDQHAKSHVSPLFNPAIPIQLASEAGFPEKLLVQDRNNFAPRVGFAFRPFNNNKTVVRGGYNIFTVGKLGAGLRGVFLPLLQTGGPFALSETFINQIPAGASDPSFAFPRPFPSTLGTAASSYSISTANPNIRDGYLQQWNLGVEHEIWSTAVGISYTGNKTTNGQYSRNINLPVPSTTPFSTARYLYRNFTSVRYFDQGATDSSHMMKLDFTRPMVQGLYLHGGYSWLSQINDAETTAWVALASQASNPYDRSRDRARIDYFPRHRFVIDWVYDLPFGKGRPFLASAPGVVNQILGGWTVSGFWRIYSGEPFSPIYGGTDPSGTGIFSGRPDRIGSGRVDNPTENRWFDASAFVVPASNIGRFGNSGRNILELPSSQATLLAVFKSFPIRERLNFRFGAYFNNPFNQHSFGSVQSDISSPNAGALLGPTFFASNWNRQIQFSGKLEF